MIKRLGAALALGLVVPVQAQSAPVDLFFSEYIEGSSNNKALEIFNGTGSAVDLGAQSYSIRIYANGSMSASSIGLVGTIADGDVFVIANSAAAPEVLGAADLVSGSINFNGDDAVALVKGDVILDVIGQIGVDPGSQWGGDLASTADNTLRRLSSVLAGDANGADPFVPSVEWQGYANNTFAGLGSHAIVEEAQAPALPEPGTLTLLALAFAGLFSLRRRPRVTASRVRVR